MCGMSSKEECCGKCGQSSEPQKQEEKSRIEIYEDMLVEGERLSKIRFQLYMQHEDAQTRSQYQELLIREFYATLSDSEVQEHFRHQRIKYGQEDI